MPIHLQSKTCTETCASFTDRQDIESQDTDQETDWSHTTIRPVGKSVDWSVSVDNQQTDVDIMQISGAGHWFLWIFWWTRVLQ